MRTCARLRDIIWASSLLLGILAPARADYISRTYQLDQSDSLPTGQSFGSVTVEAYDGNGPAGGNLNAGQVRLTFQANALPIYGATGPGFGFTQVGFNSTLPLQDSQIQLPTGWTLRPNRFMGGFGLFRWQAYGDPSALTGPLTFTINNLGTDATVDNFVIASANSTGGWPINGSVYFAGRIGGFDLNNDFFDQTSHVAGVGVPPPIIIDPIGVDGGGTNSAPPTQTPEPTTFLLALSGVGFLGLRRMWQRREIVS